MKLLVVDDNPDFRRLHIRNLRSGLKSEPLTAFEAGSFADALEIAEQEQPNLIIFDLRLEDQNEYDAPANLAVLKRAAPSALIIVASGHFDESIITKVLQAGASNFVPKGQGVVGRLLSAVSSVGTPATIQEVIEIAKQVRREQTLDP